MSVAKEAWELKKQGYSYAEIAEKLGISKSTAYKYVRDYERRQKAEEQAIDDLEKYVESSETDLKIVGVDDVVQEINKKITIVEEPKAKTKNVDVDLDDNVDKQPLHKNKFTWIIAVVAAILAAIAIYFVFFRKNDDENIEKKVEEQKKDVIEKRENTQKESTYDRVSKYGISDKVVVL